MSLVYRQRLGALTHCCCRLASTSSAQDSRVEIFDRHLKRRQRNWAARQPDFRTFTYVKEELAYRAADRIYDCTRFFDVVVDLGAGAGWIAPHVFKENVGKLIQVELSDVMSSISLDSDEVTTERVCADEETVPLAAESCDLIITSTSMHWINDIPNFLKRCYAALRPDGAIIISMLGADTLFELRCSLQLAETERLGGLAPHISPFAKCEDIGSLLARAQFDMVTMDLDSLVVRYPHMLALMTDLQHMAEQSCTYARCAHISEDVLMAASCIYREMYGDEASIPATFQCVNAIAWKPGPLMPKPAKRGSQTVSLKDLGSVTTSGQTNSK